MIKTNTQIKFETAKGVGELSLETVLFEDRRIFISDTIDMNTAKNVSERADKPLHQILNMPIGREWIFRRGKSLYTHKH